ncbi:hypothetical protein K437DRAFT_166759 [Tilletiaria anomala UBC 951]|uniref:Uncharacterized protein n=1 Tax=Tilletiaria anomala (strain ATCC 24038 / CBS 436.72 / UBC 951) TaxID=1037660 RepID=A0A066VTR7_TILAU|nr:uncharacterized protein K437DRAFT_166759 [Tilletiaria anomala UBC 951]KDN42209.1 hypothetical protein K437DRAFT_166759 [Tilletiaria anomala UBC 951]
MLTQYRAYQHERLHDILMDDTRVRPDERSLAELRSTIVALDSLCRSVVATDHSAWTSSSEYQKSRTEQERALEVQNNSPEQALFRISSYLADKLDERHAFDAALQFTKYRMGLQHFAKHNSESFVVDDDGSDEADVADSRQIAMFQFLELLADNPTLSQLFVPVRF